MEFNDDQDEDLKKEEEDEINNQDLKPKNTQIFH